MPPLLQMESEYQFIEVYQSKHYGKVFTFDECLQLTELDAPHYDEYLILQQKEVLNHNLRIQVLGGGDGYVVSELLKHSQYIETTDHVNLDRTVIDCIRKMLSLGKQFIFGQFRES